MKDRLPGAAAQNKEKEGIYKENDSYNSIDKPEKSSDLSQNVSIIIDEKGQYNKHILIDAYGYAKPGEITCIIGPSGSGKTSLLNILTQRSKVSRGSNFSGTITANSKQMQGEDFRKFGAYVP